MSEPSMIGGVDAPGRVGGEPATVAVTVVVVTDGVTPYLRQTLEAVAVQTVVAQSIVVVDVSEQDDDVAPLLEDVFDGDRLPALRRCPRAATFGHAVRDALDGAERSTWLWLLHDDSAPRADALARLRTAVEIAPSVVVAGCKQLAWADETRLLEVGVSTSRFGRRMTGLDDSEVDQGQHDAREDVLAVGLAGALVRRDVWDELGGPDPAFGPYGDGLDLSRRARLAGHRVVVVPGAAVLHAQASLGLDGHERAGWDARRSTRARREAYLRSQLVGAPLTLLPVVVVLAALSGVGRSVIRLLLKEPHLVGAELIAPVMVLARPDRLVAARRRAHRTRRLRRSTLRPLEVTWVSVLREQRDRRMADAETRRSLAAPSELEQRELAALRTKRRATLVTVLLAAVALTAATVGPVLARVLGGARLSGGSLAPGTSTIGDLWSAVLSWWVPSGLGNPGPSDPFLAVLLPVTAVAGDTGRAAAVLLVGGLVMAAAGAWFAAGAATRSVAVRAWTAVVWTGAPTLLLATSDGRLGAVIAHAGLPWVALGLARAVGVARIDVVESGLVGARREVPVDGETQAHPEPVAQSSTAEPSMAAAAGAGLAFAVVSAAAPVLFPVGVVVILLLGLWRRRRRVLWTLAPALVLQGPTVVAAASGGAWRTLLVDPGIALGAQAGPAWQQLLGWPSAGAADDWFTALVGSPLTGALAVVPFVATAMVGVVAVLALTRRPPAVRAVRLGWLIVAVGLVVAVVSSRIPVTLASADRGAAGPVDLLTAAWSGPGVSLALLGLLLAAVLGASGARPALARSAFGWRQVAAGVIVLVAWAGPGAVLAGWVATVRTDGTSLDLAAEGPIVPAAGVQLQRSPDSPRVLVLNPSDDGALTATLLRDDGVQPVDLARVVSARALSGDALAPVVDPVDEADAELAAAAAALGAGVGNGADAAADLAIGGVLVPSTVLDEADDAVSDARNALVATLDATPGLERVTLTSAGTFWRVSTDTRSVSWARLTEPGVDGTVLGSVSSSGRAVDATIDAAEDAGVTRELVLAERADPGWRAWLDGKPLRSVATTWQQAFDVGTDGGHLVVAYRPAARDGWLAAQVLVIVVTTLLAIPVRRRRT